MYLVKFPTFYMCLSFPHGSAIKNSPTSAADASVIPGKDALEAGMATHSTVLAWRILWPEEPGWLQSITGPQGQKKLDRTEHTCICALVSYWMENICSKMLFIDNSLRSSSSALGLCFVQDSLVFSMGVLIQWVFLFVDSITNKEYMTGSRLPKIICKVLSLCTY